MARFYGQTCEGGGSRTTASRCGHRNIRSSAQTWDGSLIAIARLTKDGNTEFELEISDDSSNYGETVFRGTLDELHKKLTA